MAKLLTIYPVHPIHSSSLRLQIQLFIQNCRNVKQATNKLLYAHPVLAGSFLSAMQSELADLFTQTIVERKSIKNIEWDRNFLFFFAGYILNGPIAHFLFNKAYPVLFSKARKYSVTTRIVFDQLITAPLLYFPTFYTCKYLVYERDSFRYSKWKESQNKYWCKTWKEDNLASIIIWGPAHIVTFTLIPTHWKCVWIGAVAAVRTIILSTMRGANDNDIVATFSGIH